MVEDNHNIANVNGVDTLVKASHGVVTAIHVMKGNGNSELTFRNGTTVAAPIEFVIHSDSNQSYIQLNRRFENGIFVECSDTPVRAIVVFK